MAKKGKEEELQPIIVVKKVIKKGGGHHGGAWKVAYADFVTAMMAFFLLLWLLNVTTEDAQEIISSYFDPSHPRISDSRSGSGGLLGGLSMTKVGTMAEMMQKPVQPQSTGWQKDNKEVGEQTPQPPAKNADLQKLEEQLKKEDDARFKKAKEELEKKMQENEELKELARHLQVDVTEEGLRIQILDQEGKPMFAIGSAEMFPHMILLMSKVAEVIQSMPNNISIRGHTDSHQYAPGATYTNWELSADRANSARRVLLEKGVDTGRLNDVMGKADREHLNAENPLDARNRRISIVLLRDTVENAIQRGAFEQLPESESEETGESAVPQEEEIRDTGEEGLPMIDDKPVGTFQKTPGDVYFP